MKTIEEKLASIKTLLTEKGIPFHEENGGVRINETAICISPSCEFCKFYNPLIERETMMRIPCVGMQRINRVINSLQKMLCLCKELTKININTYQLGMGGHVYIHGRESPHRCEIRVSIKDNKYKVRAIGFKDSSFGSLDETMDFIKNGLSFVLEQGNQISEESFEIGIGYINGLLTSTGLELEEIPDPVYTNNKKKHALEIKGTSLALGLFSSGDYFCYIYNTFLGVDNGDHLCLCTAIDLTRMADSIRKSLDIFKALEKLKYRAYVPKYDNIIMHNNIKHGWPIFSIQGGNSDNFCQIKWAWGKKYQNVKSDPKTKDDFIALMKKNRYYWNRTLESKDELLHGLTYDGHIPTSKLQPAPNAETYKHVGKLLYP